MAVDAATLASQLAGYDVEPFETKYSNKISTAQSQLTAYSKIKTALKSLDDKIYDMTRSGESIGKSSASLSNDEFFDLTASSNVSNMNVDIFVEQLASGHQVVMDLDATKMTDTISAGGTFTITQNGEDKTLDLSDADKDSDGNVTLSEFVDAFNSSIEGVSASVIRTDGQMKVMFTSDETGEDSQFTLSASSDSGLSETATSASDKPIKSAQDAIIWLGEQGSGTKLVNDSNTYENVISGLTIDLKKANDPSDSSVNAVVEPDSSATLEAMQALVDSFNDAISTIDTYTKRTTESTGVLATDSSMRSVSNSLKNILRGEYGGVRLFELGIEFNRDGKLEIDSTKFKDNIDKVDLNEVFMGDTGVFEQMEDTLDRYTAYSGGIIDSKRDTLNSNIDNYNDQLDRLDDRYNKLYSKYLAEFNSLNNLQSQLDSLTNLF